MNASLTIHEPTGRVWQADLPVGRSLLIGRAKENDIVLNDSRASRKHAFILSESGGFKIIDGYVENGRLLRSVNHVFVNGTMQSECLLREGDVVAIGESRLEFRTTTRPMPLTRSYESIELVAEESRAKIVNFDDAPLGHTQVQISVNEIVASSSSSGLETAPATRGEIKDLRRKAKILELLFEMSKTLGTVFDLEEIFEKATDLIFRGTPADRVIALLLEDKAGQAGDANALYQIGAKTRDTAFQSLTDKLTVSRTITQKVINERVAVLSQDAKTDEQFSGAESIVAQGIRSTICAPLITQSGVHGVIYADRLDPFSAFSPDHLELISAVAAQTAVTVETSKAHKRLAREEVARANYGRFLPEYVVQQLLEDPESIKLGGVNQIITVMFADIRGFTAMAERESPEQVVGLLNQYFTAMSEIIFDHGGTLDKYIGDGLMAIFGAPTATPEDARNAVMAAVAMQSRLVSLKRELQEQGFADIDVGMGLHTGEATVGYIGSERRSEYTAIGDTVNLASRLEANAKAGQILISEATARSAGAMFPLVPQKALTVKNRVQPAQVFEVDWMVKKIGRDLD